MVLTETVTYYLVVGVQSSFYYQYTSFRLGNMHSKFQDCTNLTLGLLHLYIVGNVHDKFQGCTADVQATMVFLLNNHRANPVE